MVHGPWNIGWDIATESAFILGKNNTSFLLLMFMNFTLESGVIMSSRIYIEYFIIPNSAFLRDFWEWRFNTCIGNLTGVAATDKHLPPNTLKYICNSSFKNNLKRRIYGKSWLEVE